jgi:nucleoside phosphorylase/CheY-like chemotaxis protein
MIQILIADDNPAKLSNIKRIIFDLNIPASFVDEALCAKDAKSFLYSKFYDLVILDLVLPNEIGDDALAKNGSMLLSDIHSSPMVKAPMYVIGLTQYDDLMSKYNEEFKSRLWHLIYYKADETLWEEQIKNIIFHLVRTRERFLQNNLKKSEYDVAIITALATPEFEAVYRLLNVKWEKVTIDQDVTHYYKGIFEGNGKRISVIAACADQMGMTAASHLTTKIILYFRPKYIIMTGIMAGIKDRNLGFGDIVVAEQSWDYGSGKMLDVIDSNEVENINFEPDTRPIQLSPELKAKISSFLLLNTALISQIQNEWQGESPKTPLKAVVGPVGSGSYVISSEKTLERIKETQRKLQGVEMEIYGLYYAADHSDPKAMAIAIKAVTDYGDGMKNDKFQKYAAFTSARFAYYFILHSLF